jgi:hypothetical protein
MNKIEDVFKAISNEREYQDRLCGEADSNGKHSVSEWILYIEDYLEEARNIVSRYASPQSSKDALHIIRKIASMSVCCMEQNGIPERDMEDLDNSCDLHGVDCSEDEEEEVSELDKCTFSVSWSDERDCIGLCAEFPDLNFLSENSEDALKGIRSLVEEKLCNPNEEKLKEEPKKEVVESFHDKRFNDIQNLLEEAINEKSNPSQIEANGEKASGVQKVLDSCFGKLHWYKNSGVGYDSRIGWFVSVRVKSGFSKSIPDLISGVVVKVEEVGVADKDDIQSIDGGSLEKANRICDIIDKSQENNHWYFDSNSIVSDDNKWAVEVIVKPGYKKYFTPTFDGIEIKVVEDGSVFPER